MALAETIPFSGFIVKIQEASGTGMVAPCAFMARALNLNKTFQEVVIPDCSDEDKAGWVNRDPLSLTWGVTGNGMMDEASIPPWNAWFVDSVARNVQVEMVQHDDTIIEYDGTGHLSTLTYSADRGGRMEFTIEIVGDGPLVIVPPVAMTAREGKSTSKSRTKTAEAA